MLVLRVARDRLTTLTSSSNVVDRMVQRHLGSPPRRFFQSIAAFLVLSLAPMAAGDGRTDFLVQRLRAEDFRVRTNAALALGATNDESVVTPLCDALADSSDVVRQAVAAALKRLAKPAALPCLR